MFQLWKLVLFCGLLAGTSASQSYADKNAVNKLKSALEEGLVTDDTMFECKSARGMISGT